MPLAKDVAAIEADVINLLQHIPGTKEEKQAYFRSRSIQVPRTNYESMWAALTTRLNRGGAASAVFELVRTKMPGRVSILLRTAKTGKPVSLLVSDPAMVYDLFFQNGRLRKLGELYLQDLEDRGVSMGRSMPQITPVVQNARRYDLALSFAGEDRAIVEEVARLLQSVGVKVFYDKFEEVELWGKDLTAHLANIYKNRADYCAMFISGHYGSKACAKLERQHAQSRALVEKREYILPILLDQSEVPGLPSTVAHIDARNLSAAQIAEKLRRKVRGGLLVEAVSLASDMGLAGNPEPVWEGLEFQGTFYAWAGPLLGLQDRDGVPCAPQLVKLLEDHGMGVSFGNLQRLSAHFGRGRFQVFATDKKNWRRPVVRDRQLLLVRRPEAMKA